MTARFLSLLRNLFRREQVQRDLDDELQAYVELLAAEKQQSGMPEQEARRAALIEAGGITQIKENVRDVHIGSQMHSIWNDIRYSVRSLAQSPLFTATVIVSLGIGIGLNSAIFSAVNAVLLRPLPYHDPDRLMYIGEGREQGSQPVGINPVNYLEWERQNTVFESMAAVFPFHHNNGQYTLTGRGEPVSIRSLRVSASFFDVLGVPAALGRTFVREEDKPGIDVAVISFELWRSKFASDPELVGQDMVLDGASHRVIGVLPQGFRFNFFDRVDVWLPNPFDAIPRTNLNSYGLRPVARLKQGITFDQMQAELVLIARSLERLHPKQNKNLRLAAVPIADFMIGDNGKSLILLMGAVGFVLLIACSNVAGLLLGRATARQREMAIRRSLGAGTSRLVRQLLTENLLLSLAGGATGLLLAHWAGSQLQRILPRNVFRLDESAVDWTVLAFGLAASLVTCLILSPAPVLTSMRADVVQALKSTGRAISSDSGGMRLRNLLVVIQVALSMVLLTGAGLMVNTIWRLQQRELGFNPKDVMFVECMLPPAEPYARDLGFRAVSPGNPDKRRFYAPEVSARLFPGRIVEQLERLPGVEVAATAIHGLPFVESQQYPFTMDGQVELTREERRRQQARLVLVAEGYIKTLEIPLLDGRLLERRDMIGPAVALVSLSMARKFWDSPRGALGKRIRIGAIPTSFEIVGVVGDIRQWARPDYAEYIYIPETRFWQPDYSELVLRGRFAVRFVVRSRLSAESLLPLVRKAVRQVDAAQPVEKVETLEEAIRINMQPWHSLLLLLGIFAAVAVLLSALGIYGVVSYVVTRRTHEIGIRMALGATPRGIVRLILQRAFWLAALGTSSGAACSLWLTRYLESRLFGVKPGDPLTMASVCVLLLGCSILASYVPAKRASQLDPTLPLRSE